MVFKGILEHFVNELYSPAILTVVLKDYFGLAFNRAFLILSKKFRSTK